MILNEAEKRAIGEKMKSPKAEIKCPRCGRLLRYEDRGASIAVICSTPGCICGGIRGI